MADQEFYWGDAYGADAWAPEYWFLVPEGAPPPEPPPEPPPPGPGEPPVPGPVLPPAPPIGVNIVSTALNFRVTGTYRA